MATRAFSIEDGNLNSRSIVTTRNKLFSDIDLTFSKRPSGDIFKKVDAAAVKQAVKNLLLTNAFEKPFQPTFGGNLNALLFELVDDESSHEIEICFIRDLSPRLILMADLRTPRILDKKRMSASLALPSTGGVLIRIFTVSPC